MSAKIRLNRVGTKSKPFYRIIVIDESSARNGMPIEVVGHYDPRKEPSIFEVNKEKVEGWLKKGALPSEVVRKHLGKIGILPAVNYDKKKKKLPKGEQPAANLSETHSSQPAAEAVQAAAPAAAPAQPPAEESK